VNIEQYISTPEVKKILYYWRRRYSQGVQEYVEGMYWERLQSGEF